MPNRPNLLPPSPAQLLEMLQKRLDRMGRFEPRKSTIVRLKEDEGRLYEYIEGILLRGTGGGNGNLSLPQEMAAYDLRKLGDWEDEVDGEEGKGGDLVDVGNASGTEPDASAGPGEIAEDAAGEQEEIVDEEDLAYTLRTTKKFGFEIAEFAVDPGQDLLVVVQIQYVPPRACRVMTLVRPLPPALDGL